MVLALNGPNPLTPSAVITSAASQGDVWISNSPREQEFATILTGIFRRVEEFTVRVSRGGELGT